MRVCYVCAIWCAVDLICRAFLRRACRLTRDICCRRPEKREIFCVHFLRGQRIGIGSQSCGWNFSALQIKWLVCYNDPDVVCKDWRSRELAKAVRGDFGPVWVFRLGARRTSVERDFLEWKLTRFNCGLGMMFPPGITRCKTQSFRTDEHACKSETVRSERRE